MNAWGLRTLVLNHHLIISMYLLSLTLISACRPRIQVSSPVFEQQTLSEAAISCRHESNGFDMDDEVTFAELEDMS